MKYKRKYHVSFDVEAFGDDYSLPSLIEDTPLTAGNIKSQLIYDYTRRGEGWAVLRNIKITKRK